MGSTKLNLVPITTPVNHVISHAATGINGERKSCRWYLLIPQVKGNNGLCIIRGHRLIIFSLVIARIGNGVIDPFHKTSLCKGPQQRWSHIPIVDMGWGNFQGNW